MKILCVRLKNLNSLVGEWIIDFTDPSYTSDGIFAIVGRTGAGKSTILDGICLALYGQTPRLGKLTQGSNEIMSRGTGECTAEVQFETVQGRYRATWQQRRARGNAEGNLQGAKHEVVHADTDEILADMVARVPAKVEELTGLSFDQFTRSVLLAQGKFAAFLQSNANERAPILEQITGTEVYSEISKAVFERNRTESQNLESLRVCIAGIETLSPEKLVELELEKENLQAICEQTKLAIAETMMQIDWLKGIEKLRNSIQTEESRQDILSKQLQDFEPRRQQLDRDQSARQFDVQLAHIATIRGERIQCTNEIDSHQEAIKKLDGTLSNKEAQIQSVAEGLEAAKRSLASDSELFQQVRLMDATIKDQNGQIELKARSLVEEQKRLSEVRTQLTDKNEEITAAKRSLEEIDTYLKNHSEDGDLVESYSGIESDYCTWESQAGDLKLKKESLATEQAALNQCIKSVANENDALRMHRERVKQAETALQNGDRELKFILAGKLLREHESQLRHLIEQKRLRGVIKSMEDHRKDLKTGEPCPLCGSIEHPYSTGEVPSPDELNTEIQQIEDLIKKAHNTERANMQLQMSLQREQSNEQQSSTRLDGLQVALDGHKKRVEVCQQSIDAIQVSYDELQEALREKLKPFGLELVSIEESGGLLDHLEQRLGTWKEKTAQKQAVDTQVQIHLVQSEGLEARVAEIAKGVEDRSSELEALQIACKALCYERKKLFGIKDPDQERQALVKKIAELETNYAMMQSDLRQDKESLVKMQGFLAGCSARADILMNQLQVASNSLSQELQKVGFRDEAECVAAKLGEKTRLEWIDEQMKINHSIHANRESLARNRKALELELGRGLTSRSALELEQQKAHHEQVFVEVNRKIGENTAALNRHRENEMTLAGRKVELDRQIVESERWKSLSGLIGSADGKSYRNFVQGLTFERLIAYSNQQLSEMTDRYLLVASKDAPLELNVIDNYQASAERTTKNLSGGESFIVSLALALGLSRMASQKIRVDSLFMDEGFGTLDEESLNMALDTLSALQQEGKVIGVISHVKALKERIATQIVVSSAGMGRSKLHGPGCKKI